MVKSNKWLGYFTYRKFKSFQFTLKRIDERYKPYFREIFIREWGRALENDEIDYTLFNSVELAWIRENLESELLVGSTASLAPAGMENGQGTIR